MSYELFLFLIDVGELFQYVSCVVYWGSLLYYGCSSMNCYDDLVGVYGVFYLGCDLFMVLMELVFYKYQWFEDMKCFIVLKEVYVWMVCVVGVLDDVFLVDFMVLGVMVGYFGLNLEQLVSCDYMYMQQVFVQVYVMVGDDGQLLFDGVFYLLCNNYFVVSIVLFECVGMKVSVVEDIDLVDYVDWLCFVVIYCIGVEFDFGLVELDDEVF